MKALESVAAVELVRPQTNPIYKLATIALYTLGFFGALPAALVRLGQRADVELSLPLPSLLLRFMLGGVFLVSGAGLLLRAGWELWSRGRGLPISHLPPSKLVASGPFRRLRHPIYVGYTLALSGAGFALGSLGVACLAPLLLLLGWLGYAQSVEEPRLLGRFGEDYRRYVQRTQLLPLPARFTTACARALELVWQALRPPIAWLARQTVLFRIGPTLWVGYGALVAVGAALGGLVALGLLAPVMPAVVVAKYLVGISLAMLMGGRLAWLGYEHRALRAAPGATLRRVGFVSFGAYAAMFLYAVLWSRWQLTELPLGWLLDRTMAACLICSGFGRLGCLSYGCCYGRVWPAGIVYRDPQAKVLRELGPAGAQPRMPAQLVSALLAFGAALLMLGTLALGAGPGFATGLGALCYALGRFHVERLRDELRVLDGRLTRGQLSSMAIAGAALLWLASPSALLGAAEQAGLVFAWAEVRAHLAVPLLAALPVFLVCGYHRHRVGCW